MASLSNEIDFDSPVVVLLDACTLVVSSLRDVLLRCSAAGFYQVRWSPTILDEVRGTLSDRISIADNRIDHLCAALERAFPDAKVECSEQVPPDLVVDADDLHVVQAAVADDVNVIVTANVRHFREDKLHDAGILLRTPDRFLVELFSHFPDEIAQVVVNRASDLGDTVPETLEFLRQHVPGFVRSLESHLS